MSLESLELAEARDERDRFRAALRAVMQWAEPEGEPEAERDWAKANALLADATLEAREGD